MEANIVREAAGVFADETSLRNAADELLQSGFDRAALSIMADEADVVSAIGRHYDHVREIQDHPALPRAAYSAGDSRTEAEAGITGGLGYVGAVGAAATMAASGGAFAPIVVAALAGGGGGALLGGMIAGALHRRHASRIREHLHRGGLALFVGTDDEAQEHKALAILERNAATDVHMHGVPVSSQLWSRGGVSYVTSFMNALHL